MKKEKLFLAIICLSFATGASANDMKCDVLIANFKSLNSLGELEKKEFVDNSVKYDCFHYDGAAQLAMCKMAKAKLGIVGQVGRLAAHIYLTNRCVSVVVD
jgi:hypothetical protein